MDIELSRFVDALPGLVWTASCHGRIDFLSHQWEAFTGLTVDELHGGEVWQSALHPDDLLPFIERWQLILESGRPGEIEARLRRFDGKYCWLLFRTSPFVDSKGQIERWYGLGVDIEDRRQTEQSHRMRGDRYELIVDGFPAIVSLRNASGNLAHVNRRFVEYSGETLETLKANPWHSTWHPDDRPAARAAWQAALNTGNPCDFEGRRRRADGAYRWFHMRAQPLHEADGGIVLWYLLQTDIDDQRRAEARLASERLLLERVARGYPLIETLEAVCHQFQSCSPGALCSVALFARSGKRLELGVAPSLQPTFAAAFLGQDIQNDAWPDAMAVHTNGPVIVSDLASETRWSGGAWNSIALAHGLRSCWSVPIAASDGNPIGAFAIYHEAPCAPAPADFGLMEQFTQIAGIAIGRDRSDDALGKAQADLARVARATSLGALTASIAHEVNQPLSGIVTNASTCLRMLAADPPNVDGARETARRTIRDGRRAADVISRLRSLFIKKAARNDLVNLNDVAREVIALSSRELQRNEVVLQARLADRLPYVSGDRVQLQQVILNLLMNASDAMSGVNDRQRHLVIGTECDDAGRVRVAVEDAGTGIDPQLVDRLFDAFYTTKVGGMGIGLSVSRSIIESHRGRLWATPNEGPGTTFAFSLPVEPESMPGTHNPGADQGPAAEDAANAAGNS